MGDQDVGGLLQAQAEELHLLLAVLVDSKNLVLESSAVDVVLKDIDPVRLGNSLPTKQQKEQLNQWQVGDQYSIALMSYYLVTFPYYNYNCN